MLNERAEEEQVMQPYINLADPRRVGSRAVSRSLSSMMSRSRTRSPGEGPGLGPPGPGGLGDLGGEGGLGDLDSGLGSDNSAQSFLEGLSDYSRPEGATDQLVSAPTPLTDG